MNTEFAKVANDAATITSSGRLDAVKVRIRFLAENPGVGNAWWVQLVGGLCCQTLSEYRALNGAYERKENGDAALLAWRARNLLELRVWAAYCAKGRENALRLSQRALSNGIESLEGLSAAARECGIGEEFSVSYGMLSKFAHPTAVQIMAPHDSREALRRGLSYRKGCLFFCVAFETLEGQLLETGAAAHTYWQSASRCGDEAELTVGA